MRAHLVDGTYELFRAHFSRRPDRRDPDGRDVKATTGLVESLLALLHEEREAVTHVAVAFDNPIESLRNERFPGYKSSQGVDPALLAQFDRAEEAVRALGITVWSMDRYEADDALATAAARWAEQVDQVRVLTVDKDLGQCLRGERVVQVDRRRERVIDEPALRALRGVGPASIPDWLALVGDTADGLPGIPGFGERSATAVLAVYEHLEAIPTLGLRWRDVDVRGRERLAATLAERLDEALLYRELATLATDVPLAEELDDLAWVGVPRDSFAAWCQAIGVERLAHRPARWV